MYGDRHNDRLSKLINQIYHVWEDEAAENDAKLRATINSIASEHDLDRFNMQKAFKNAIASKNNEINELITECKRMKYLLSQYSAENKELHKKLESAHRMIDSLRGSNDDASEHSVHSGHSLSRGSSKPLNPDASVFGEGILFSSEGASFGPKQSHPPPTGWEAHGYNLPPGLESGGEGYSGHPGPAAERGGTMTEFGGLFSPSPSLSPFSPALTEARSTVAVSSPTGSTSSASGAAQMLGGGRFVVDGDREGHEFVASAKSLGFPPSAVETDMGPPPGFQSSGSSPSSVRATSRLVGVGGASTGGEAKDEFGTDEAAGALINQIRLQSKSSRLDARPVDTSLTQDGVAGTHTSPSPSTSSAPGDSNGA